MYLFKVNNRTTRKKCEIWSILTVMTPERRHWFRSGVLIVNFERISKLFLMFFIHASISIEISSQCNIGNFSLERVIFVPFPSRDFVQSFKNLFNIDEE